MIGGKKEEVIAAIRSHDSGALEAAGWLPFAQYLKKASASRFDWGHLEAFALTYGDQEPTDLLDAAVTAVASGATNGYRPTVAQLAQHLPAPAANNPEPSARRDIQPDALATVHRLVAGGTRVCACQPSPTTLHIDAAGTLRCFNCGGLEVGQVDQASEAA